MAEADDAGRVALERDAALTDARRVRRAREAQLLTQSELARLITERTGHAVSAPALSQIERGVSKPSPETLAALAATLDHPVRFFVTRTGRNGGDAEPWGFFRTLRSTTARDRRGALARAFLIHDFVTVIERHVRIPEADVPQFDVPDGPDGRSHAAAAAREVRRAWGLDPGPIPDVVRCLERHGIVVARLTTKVQSMDAFSVYFPHRPLVVLGNDKGKRDRSRFDAGHELGHLVVHRSKAEWSTEIEKQAHAFCGEFLMPREDILPELQDEKLTWSRLLDLKIRWGTSISSLVRRAHDLKVISPPAYANWMKAISARGWRVDEPGDAELGAPEAPVLLERLVDRLSDMGLSVEDLAIEAGLPPDPIRMIVEACRDPRPRLDL